MLVAVIGATLVASLLHLPAETIGSRFGGIPHGLPAPQLPAISLERLVALLPTALSFTLLGGLESLLSAKVADGMTGRVHRSNMELVAQGIANVASALFGGISVTGTIARTATNIRAGAQTPVAGMLHAVFLLIFMIIAAPLASYVPLTALAGLLVVVAWNMVERREFASLMTQWRAAIVLLATFGLTLLVDLTAGIMVGCGLAALFWGIARLRSKITRP
jgi:SulP family sulfate permease